MFLLLPSRGSLARPTSAGAFGQFCAVATLAGLCGGLACDAYSRLLRNPALRKHFRTEDTIAAFWKLPDGQRRGLWDTPLDIAQEPFVQEYDQWGRASVN